ncbi:hypothetical protein JCM18909_3367 [Cutibacterium acnes JCM 18909]|nr:hypothetical protein JCM18909_3367 [Cutibacterium acnes JCM 18909]
MRSIVGATLGFGHGELDHHSDSCDIYSTVSRCLDDTVEHFGLVIAKEELYGSVSKHVGRLMAHAPSMPYFRNTLRESLRSRSPFLYDAAVYLADKLSRLLGIFFTDDEIGLLAIYIGLYSEPAPNPNLVTAVVVCPRYQALRDVLLAGLVDHFANRMRMCGHRFICRGSGYVRWRHRDIDDRRTVAPPYLCSHQRVDVGSRSVGDRFCAPEGQ